MEGEVDVLCASTVLLIAVAALASYAWGGARESLRGFEREAERESNLPRGVTRAALGGLAPVARAAMALGVSARAITAFSVAIGAGAGLSLAVGHFGIAAALFVVASLGDALDGLVARATGTASPAGALFDSSADRYEEFFAFGGLAFYFRSSEWLLPLMLFALLGSFMVSYGSAKAEALGVKVPGGLLRRAERAVCLALGTTLSPIASAVSLRTGGPAWAGVVPIAAAAAIIAVGANVSAIRRLRAIGAAVARPPSPRDVDARSAMDSPQATLATPTSER